MGSRRVAYVIGIAAVALLVAAVVLAALDLSGRLPGGFVADPTPSPSPTARPLDPRPVDAPEVLPSEPTAPTGAPAVPTAALVRALSSGALGPDQAALVLDVASRTVLLDRAGTVARTPASLAKLATGAAALRVLDVSSRLRTRVVAGAVAGDVVLVGAGDTTLTTAPTDAPPRRQAFPGRASLAELADTTAEALTAAGTTSVRVRVDDSLFSGPAVSPDWRSTYVGAGVVSPVSALSVDAGRVRPSSDLREADPALAAGRDLARLLGRSGLTVAGEVERAVAPAGSAELSAVSSPTVAELVELMLMSSDNDLAESLLRLVAVGQGRPGTFSDGTAAVTAELAGLGVPTEGMLLLDGSGLARGSRIAPDTLARLLALAAGGPTGGSPRGLGHLVAGLPVAGFSGTLSQRFDAGRVVAAAGLVRAKTGTLTGVSTLAGVTSVAGRPVAFAVMSDRVPGDTLAARAALDRFAATLARARPAAPGVRPGAAG